MTHLPSSTPEGRLTPGQQLGPYEIVEVLGVGGMGEVYRAHDRRLRRDVALKVIRPALVKPAYVERLGREARAAAALNHPNILAVYDVNTDGPVPYVVSELLNGESLRDRLERGALPLAKALELGVQIAQALAAAHSKGILHRDVKPGNVFLTSDGQVKLLDFGLAKLEVDDLADPETVTASDPSRPGHVIGTAGYMAPEQVLGEPLDDRADIFGLGAVLYEMLTARRAFRGSTRSEIINAVLTQEPEDLLALNRSLPPAAVAAVRRCLEKNGEERFQSARDLAFHLRQIAQPTTDTHSVSPSRFPRRRRTVAGVGLALAVGLAAVAAVVALRPGTPPTFQQLTFQRGRIGGARFAGEAVVYSQSVGYGEPDVWLRLAASPESRPLEYDATVLATRSGELAMLTHSRFAGGRRFVGNLAIAPVGGGTPYEVLEDVEDADWEPASGDFAVARSKGLGAGSELEYPIGRVLYRSPGSIHSPRISRDRRRVAFLEDPAGLGDGGRIVVLDGDGAVELRTETWTRARGLCWSPEGDEVWFAAAEGTTNRLLRAVGIDGTTRLVHESPGSLSLLDVAVDGRVLLAREDERMAIVGVPPGSRSERELSWFDDAGIAALSRDGSLLLFGDRFGIYLRRTDGSPAAKLGEAEGYADDLSPDGSLALTTNPATNELVLVPTGPGRPRAVGIEGSYSFFGAFFFPDGRRILFNGREPNRGLRSYVVSVSGGRPRALTEEGTWARAVSPDGETLAATSQDRGVSLWPVGGGRPQEVPGSISGDRPVTWSSDGRSLWVFRRGEVPASVYRVDVATGERTLWRTLAPPDAAGVYSVDRFEVTPTGDAYFYSYRQGLSELYEARGLH
jgi:Tol biopolymer transport system component